jgi:hypothetical protein
MRHLILLPLSLAVVLCVSSCGSSSPPPPPMVQEAADYGPVGEALKFLGLCFLGISIICAVATIIKNIIQR